MSLGMYPAVRLRRNRSQAWLREMVAEYRLQVSDLIWPVFVQEGKGERTPIKTMPGVERLSLDLLVKECQKAADLGIPAVAVFPVVPAERKSLGAEEAFNEGNLVCRTVAEIKAKVKNLGVICDVALDPYTTHGHDGIVKDGDVANDETVEILCRQALVQARAGCDVVAPSDMMDGRVAAIRSALDDAGHVNTCILSYAAKYASAFYGPFRDAVGSATALGKADKRTYQMDPANAAEALREVAQDVAEGADMVMVKPGMPYLDIIRRVKEHVNVPVLAYQVSGEYAMMKAAAAQGAVDFDAVMLESLLAFRRAGASAILSYAAMEIAKKLITKE